MASHLNTSIATPLPMDNFLKKFPLFQWRNLWIDTIPHFVLMKITWDPYFTMNHDVTLWLGYKKPAKMDEKYKYFSPRSVLIPLDKENIVFMKNQMLHIVQNALMPMTWR